jgi:hypothetical protein
VNYLTKDYFKEELVKGVDFDRRVFWVMNDVNKSFIQCVATIFQHEPSSLTRDNRMKDLICAYGEVSKEVEVYVRDENGEVGTDA